MKKTLAFVTAFASLSAQAALVSISEPADATKLFTSEFKIDQNIQANGQGSQRGHDLFLREGEQFTGSSTNYRWEADYNYDETFRWTLSRDTSNVTTLVFDDKTLTHTSLPGEWNALAFYINQMGRDNMQNPMVTATVMGQTVELPAGDNTGTLYFAMSDFSEFSSVSGEVRYRYTTSENVSSPSGRMALSIKALNVSVPAPATALLMVAGLGLMAARRRKI